MKEIYVNKAINFFTNNQYIDAIIYFKKAGARLGNSFFNINISICEKKLFENSKKYLNEYVKIVDSDEEFVENSIKLRSIEIKTDDENLIELYGKLIYDNKITDKNKKALLIIQCFDKNLNEIDSLIEGFAFSEKYGKYKYISDTSGEERKLARIKPPLNTEYIKLSLSSFNLKGSEYVLFGSKLKVKKTKLNNEYNEKVDELSVIGWPEIVFNNDKKRVLSVFDEFSRDCFAPHANLIEPRPDNAIELMRRDKPDIVLVESSWRGNKGSWQYRVAKYSNPFGNELRNLLLETKKNGIPTVFWNKEDPVHFENFIESASCFDYVFTTAEEAVNLYKTAGVKNIYTLPFAAETSIHNPINSKSRNNKICFAGSYYANRFKDRRDDQLMLLTAAKDFDLDIYDRNSNSKNKDFRFPENFFDNIRPQLSYEEMNIAYKKYKVFLNVNSVIDSRTMFSRRVFELLASGTPVVSTQSVGIDEFFGKDLIFTVKTMEEAREALLVLTNDHVEWRRRSIQGIREVFKKHTYKHRFNEIMQITGITNPRVKNNKVLLIAEVENQQNVYELEKNFTRQTLENIEYKLVLVTQNNEIFQLSENSKIIINQSVNYDLIKSECKEFQADYCGFLQPDARYGRSYIEDSLICFEYTNANFVGKSYLHNDLYEYSKDISPGSLIFKVSQIDFINKQLNNISHIEEDLYRMLGVENFYIPDSANFLNTGNIKDEEVKADKLFMEI